MASSEPSSSARTFENSTIDSGFRLRPPRSLPPWIDSYEARYGPVSDEQLRLLKLPARIVQHQSNFAPVEPQRRVSRDGFVAWEDDPQLGAARKATSRIPHILRYGRASMRGRKWDHLRSSEPVIVSKYKAASPQSSLSWSDFVRSSSWGGRTNEVSQVVSYDALDRLQPNFNSEIKVQFHHAEGRGKDGRRSAALSKRVWNGITQHPLSPFFFRLGVMVTSVLALGMSARIYQLENTLQVRNAERTQSVVAIVVDCLAVPYIGYMIWDEYTGKPLGLRSAMSKISLILLDLFFIIFKSASTALAFESLTYHTTWHALLTHLSKVLAAFQLIGLMSWSMTFTINIIRTVKRLGGGGDDNNDSNV